MGEPRGFLKWDRETPQRRRIILRVQDWQEVYEKFPADDLKHQAGRCMDCGIPFCNNGCPLGNLIPDWNDLVYRGHWQDAIERLHATNNFPEFTGRLCPAPCESACVLGINSDAVTIKQVEVEKPQENKLNQPAKNKANEIKNEPKEQPKQPEPIKQEDQKPNNQQKGLKF